MVNSVFWLVSVFVLCLIFSAFFSCAEAACTGLSRLKISNLAKKNSRFVLLIRLLSKPQKLLVGLFIGQHLFSSGAIVCAAYLTFSTLPQYGVDNTWFAMLGLTLVVSLLLVLTSDMLPRTLAATRPEKLAVILSKPIQLSLFLLTPFIVIFEWIMQVVSHISGHVYLDPNRLITADEIKNLITMGEKEGVIESVEKEMIHSIFQISETVVREIMTPRTDIISLVLDTTVEQAIQVIKTHGHSRIPVFEDKVDNMIGVIYAKDLLTVSEREAGIKAFLREPVFVPETQNIVDLLHHMKKSKFHLALVVDEYGGISGLVTLEDIIEEIIGEVQDEYDQDEKPEFEQLSPTHFLADAGMNVDDLSQRIGIDFPQEEDFDTIGGFVLSLMGKFPTRGEEVSFQNLKFKVRDVSKRRILSVEIFVHE